VENKFITIQIPQKIKLDYQITGEGKPILFLHGGGRDYRAYHEFLDFVSKNYKVYTFSYPGFGNSSNIKKYSVDNFNIIIDKFLEEMLLKEIFIIGHSMGGGLALSYASYQSRDIEIKGLAIISPLIYPIKKSLRRMIKDLTMQINYNKRPSIKPDNSIVNIFKYIFARSKHISYMVNSLRIFYFLKKISISKHLGQINIPVIGFYSDNDLVLDSSDQLRGLKHLTSCNIIHFKHEGHNAIDIEKERILIEISKVY